VHFKRDADSEPVRQLIPARARRRTTNVPPLLSLLRVKLEANHLLGIGANCVIDLLHAETSNRLPAQLLEESHHKGRAPAVFVCIAVLRQVFLRRSDELFIWKWLVSLTAALAGFGRTTSEVGAILVIGGNIAGHIRTMTTSKGNLLLALGLGFVLIVISTAASATAEDPDDGWSTASCKYFQKAADRTGVAVTVGISHMWNGPFLKR